MTSRRWRDDDVWIRPRVRRRAGRILGGSIADAVSLLNPRVVVIGGQLAQVEEQLLAGIRQMVYGRSLPLATRRLQIVPTRLGGGAGLIGLALLLADRIFAPDRVEQLLVRARPTPGRDEAKSDGRTARHFAEESGSAPTGTMRR